MKAVRLRSTPHVAFIALGCVLLLIPGLFLLAIGAGKVTFKEFLDGPVWLGATALFLFLLRREARIAPPNGRLRLSWGLWIPGLWVLPFFWRHRPLQGVRGVQIQTESRGSGEKRSTVCAVRLTVEGGVRGDLLADCMRYLAARRLGERAAGALGLPLSDMFHRNGEETSRPAASLSKSLQQRLREGELDSPEPRRPEGSDLVLREEAGRLQVDRPPLMRFAIPRATLLFFLLIHGVLAFEIGHGGSGTQDGGIALRVIWILFGGISALAILGTLDIATVRWRVELDARRVRFLRRSWVFRRSAGIAVDELEELVVTDVLRLQGDRGSVTFGKDLEPEERAWIRDELLRGLKGP